MWAASGGTDLLPLLHLLDGCHESDVANLHATPSAIRYRPDAASGFVPNSSARYGLLTLVSFVLRNVYTEV